MRARIAVIVSLMLAAAPAWAADIVGSYDVEGKNPKGGSYQGTVVVKRAAEGIFDVTWDIDGSKSVGTGIGDGTKALAVGYKNGSSYGVCLIEITEGEPKVFWTYGGGKQFGTERWTRQ